MSDTPKDNQGQNEDSLIDIPEVAETTTVSDNIRASWNFSLDRIRQSTKHYSPDAQDALVGLFLWCTDDRHPIFRADAATAVECSSNLIYQLLTGVYRNPTDKTLKQPSPDLIVRIRKFLKAELTKFQAVETDFVITPTAQKVFEACELAIESRRPVILWGPSQLGKTWALRRFRHTHNHGKTGMCELEAACGLGGMVRTWARSLSLSDKSCTTNLIDRVKGAMGADMFMILDEVHLLQHTYRLGSFFASIEVIRRIWDYKQMPLLLSWTDIDNLRANCTKELVQVWRRAVHKIALPAMVTREDMEAFSTHYKLEFPSKDLTYDFPVKKGEPIVENPREILQKLAKFDGLAAIAERFRYAKKLAAKQKGAQLSWYHFTKAHLIIEANAQQDTDCGWGEAEKKK